MAQIKKKTESINTFDNSINVIKMSGLVVLLWCNHTAIYSQVYVTNNNNNTMSLYVMHIYNVII